MKDITATTTSKTSPILGVLAIRDFRLLWIGSATSMLGDQFSLIATPWLVLKMTGDPLALGLVVALQGIPRAVFMLVGGAITDRISQRTIMLISDVIRMALTAAMTILVLSGAIQLWMLYIFSLAFGLVAGFSIPASNSIVPTLVPEQDLQAGNSISMGTAQLTSFIGPTIAGVLIGHFSVSALGVGLAYGIDTLSFGASILALWLLRAGRQVKQASDGTEESIWASIGAGFRYLWTTPALRLLFVVISAANFLFVGPLLVGIPVLANQRLPEGALAFGLLISAYSGGNLVGYVLAGALPKVGGRTMATLLIGLLFVFGLVVASLGWITVTGLAIALLLGLGAGNGYISIMMFTQIQTRTPREMLGRMMSMIMLSNFGMAPLSQAIAGAVSKWSLTGLFAGAGLLMLVLAVWAAFQPELRTYAAELVE